MGFWPARALRGCRRWSPRLLFGGGLIGIGLIDLGLANTARLAPRGVSPVFLAAAFMILAGFPAVAGMAAGNGLLQFITSAFAVGFLAPWAANGVATLVGLGLGGLAIDVVGVVPVISAGALMWVAGGVVALVRLPRERGDATARGQRPGEA